MDFSKIRLNLPSEENLSESEDTVVVDGSNSVSKGEVAGSTGLNFGRLRLPSSGDSGSVGGPGANDVVPVVVPEDSVSDSVLGVDSGTVEAFVDYDVDVDFDSQLSDLLSGDEFDEVVDGPVSTVVDSVESSVDDGVERVVGSRRSAPKSGERRRARARARSRRYGGSTEYRDRFRGLDSEIGARGAVEHVVDSEGRRVSQSGSGGLFGKVSQAAESGSSVALPDNVIGTGEVVSADSEVEENIFYKWKSPVDRVVGDASKGVSLRKKVHDRELAFFRELGKSQYSTLDGEAGVKVRGTVSNSVGKGSVRLTRASAVGGTEALMVGSGVGLTDKDLDIVEYLARLKFATANQVSHLHGTVEGTVVNRLRALKAKGLVDSVTMMGSVPLWFVTSSGMLLSGYNLPLVSKNGISYSQIYHNFVLNNVAANLFGGNVNVLALDDFPARNRVDRRGRLVVGEEFVSETEIQSSFSKMRLLNKSEKYRPVIMGNIDREFADWERLGDVSVPSPEMSFGNEYMWMIFPPAFLKKVYHAPDLVVRRPRAADGSPQSIAVEVEINNKDADRYDNILLCYQKDVRLYSKVVWVCRDMQTAKAIELSAKKVGLWDEDRIDIVGIMTSEGIFEGRDIWTI